MNSNTTIILFDQDVQPYRVPIYERLNTLFSELNFNFKVYYDIKLNYITPQNRKLFEGIDYSFNSFKAKTLLNKPVIVIQFVWLRYKFLIPFMIWAKVKNIKIIVWSHGINLQKKNQKYVNLLYYLRQFLSSALIIYTPEQRKFIKASHKKLFVANNTLYFDSFPKIDKQKDELKTDFGLSNIKIILSIARFDVNNRKPMDLLNLADLLDDSYHIIIVGSGIDMAIKEIMDSHQRITYMGVIYDQTIICKLYKLADLFIMPGAIGLAINQSFFFGTPIVLADVEHGPEVYYFEEAKNGFLYESGNILDLKSKIDLIIENYSYFENGALETIQNKALFNKMEQGFIQAIKYVKSN